MMNKRRAPRLSVNCQVSFAIEDTEGTGTVYNISEHGCAVTTAVPVPDEGYASASITVPGQREPIIVELAHVRWASPNEFGLEFQILRGNSRRRLLQFLASAQAA